jgi:hypothetical protein
MIKSSIQINSEKTNLLKFFFDNNPNGKKTFRYYDKRPFSIIENHLKTNLYLDENSNIVGYGHLDFEDKIWLGIMVGDTYKKMGYGKYIMDDLLKNIDLDIYLSVDKINIEALTLYKKKGFIIDSESETFYFMKKIKN